MIQRVAFLLILIVAWIACLSGSLLSWSHETPRIDYDDSAYALVLSRYVNDRGEVNYRDLKAHSEELERFLLTLESLDRGVYDRWPEQEQLAFWINAYNALALKIILDHYPIQATFLGSLLHPKNSILQIPDARESLTFSVMGTPRTLDDIQHAIIRKEFREPRIHLALAYTAKSSPPLRNQPYTGERLAEQLDDQVRKIFTRPSLFAIDRDAKVLYISPLFNLYGEDFISRYRDDNQPAVRSQKQRAVIQFLSLYAEGEIQKCLQSYQYRVAYLDFDWTLNEPGETQNR